MDRLVTHVQRFVIQQLFEFSRRNFVGGQVPLVLAIPVKFDSARHTPTVYRNVYTLDDPAPIPAPDQVSIHMPGQAY
jgi:hypothetical protein